jgi:drug/metabolite transporter (DMT)-like permease
MKARLVWLILCGIWGSTWLFIKLGLQDLPPLTFAGIRFVIACTILFAWIRIRRLQLPTTRSDWGFLAVTGILSFGLNYGLVFWGEQYISSGLAALLQATLPAFGLVFAHFHLPGERLSWARIGGVILGVCGVGVVFSNQLAVAGRQAFAGCVALILSALFAAYANVLVKARGIKMDPAILAAGQMFFGLLLLFAVGLPLEGNPLNFRWTPMALISLRALLLAGAQDRRYKIDVDSISHSGCRRHTRNDCSGRRDRLAHPHRRRNDHDRHQFHRRASRKKET